MQLRLISAISAILFLAACGSGDGSGTLPTLSPDASIVRPTSDAGGEAAAAPAETQPPVVEAPAEEAPAAKEAPAEEAPAEAAPSTSVALGEDEDGDTVWWPWVLGALVIIVAIVALSRRRKPAPGVTSPSRTTALFDDIDQLTNHLAALAPDGLNAVAAADAATLATMRAALSGLIASAPDAHTQAVLGTLTAPISALHAAVDAVALSAGQSLDASTSTVAPLAVQLHTASTSARAQLAVQQ